jgi:hypothetical protein
MRNFAIGLAAVLLCSCAHQQGVRVADPYETVTIDQMEGNQVSGTVLARTIVCLNARRETHLVTSLTSQTVSLATNVSLIYVTNQTITFSTNLVVTLATNDIPPAVTVVAATTESDTNAPPTTPAPPPASSTTNVALTTANNASVSRAGNQTVSSASSQLQRSRQVTHNANNLSVTTADNLNITGETNSTVTVVTNLTVNSTTNVAVTLTNMPVHDYFVWVEFTPPPDFLLQSGESLVLLVDGVRYSLAQTTTPSVIVPRRGFVAALYRVPPQLLVDIANAREVKLRLKGTSAVIEREMSESSRKNFKKFLVKYFQPENPENLRVAEAKQVANK